MKAVKCTVCGKGFELFYEPPKGEFICVVCRHKPNKKEVEKQKRLDWVALRSVKVKEGFVFWYAYDTSNGQLLYVGEDHDEIRMLFETDGYTFVVDEDKSYK